MSEDKANEPAAEDRATDPSGDAQASESATPREEGEWAPDAGTITPGDETQMGESTTPRKDEVSPFGGEPDWLTAFTRAPAPPAPLTEAEIGPMDIPPPTVLEAEEPESGVEEEAEVEGEAEEGATAGVEIEPEPEPAFEAKAEKEAEEEEEAEEEATVSVEIEPEPAPDVKAAKEAKPEKEKVTYYYPNKWARIILTSAEEVMGRQGVNAMLNMAKLPEYIGNYPPDNMKKAFSFEGVGQLQEAIWDFYGPRGARVFAVRAGEQAFREGLAQFRSVAAAAQVAMRVGSLEAKVKLGLDFFSKFFNTVSDQVVEIDEDEKHWIWRITRCPVCWEREADEPVCHLAIGVLQAALAWTTENKKFRVMETECKAKGDEYCVIKIEKIPVE